MTNYTNSDTMPGTGPLEDPRLTAPDPDERVTRREALRLLDVATHALLDLRHQDHAPGVAWALEGVWEILCRVEAEIEDNGPMAPLGCFGGEEE